MNKLLCYELNEVPWRVVDHYIQRRPNSSLGSLLSRSAQFTTNCNDHGELHPWSTWPTLHRGVSNEVHKIHFLNQDLESANGWPPVWDILTKNGITTGIFGSLQSYPPVTSDNMLFHIPDTFAAGPETIPDRFEAFQAFNLKQTGENKAQASAVNVGDISLALGLLKAGIKPTTYAKVAKHLISEKFNSLFKTRRALLQPELAFDAFLRCLKEEQPQFVTFFSNHVAGIMHRYWKYAFPEDFDHTIGDDTTDQFHAASLMNAMDIFETQLGKLVSFANKNGYQILVMSSMGQEAIDRGEYVDELKLNDIDKLAESLGCTYPLKQNLAMQPDIAFEFETIEDLHDCRKRLENVTDTDGKRIIEQRYAEVGKTLNMVLCSSKALIKDQVVSVAGTHDSLENIGLGLMNRDQGTAYHQPEGILIWEGFKSNQESRTKIDSRQVLPTVLKHFGLQREGYMQSAIETNGVIAA